MYCLHWREFASAKEIAETQLQNGNALWREGVTVDIRAETIGAARLQARSLRTLATTKANSAQRWAAAAVCLLFGIATALLLPIASRDAGTGQGFLAVDQSMLVVVYGLTTFLLFAQHGRSRSPAVLALAAGSLFTTIIVFVQLLTFPNLLVPGRLFGNSPATTLWLWMFWHLGPPAYATAFAYFSRGGLGRSDTRASDGATWVAATSAVAAALVCAAIARYMIDFLPLISGPDGSYALLMPTGVGPAVVLANLLALALLWGWTRFRTVLQLWTGVSLGLLLFDNLVTIPAAARETVGWVAGRVEALLAGVAILGVLLREIEQLHSQAEHTAVAREREGAELRLARDNLAMALEAAEMGDWELDMATGESRRTLNHDRIFGYDRLLPRWGLADLYAHVVPEDRAAARAAIEGAWRTGTFDLVCRINPAGAAATRWIAKRGKAYFDESGKPTKMAGVVMDVTDRHDMDQRLAQAQRMEAIGQLTGGVAHDFNNVLTVIVGNLDMLSRTPDDPARVARLASIGLLAARRGAEMTEKLLAFARRQTLRPETLDAGRIVEDFLPLLERALGETIRLEMARDAQDCCVRVDRQQFEAALLNLAVNARDAGAGSVRIESRRVALDGGDPVLRSDMKPGAFVRLEVTDDGAGMDQATIARAVEPFFTTKEVGKGTGLGLSQVYGFARQAGGCVDIHSAVGRGTTITIFLPEAADADPALHAPQGAAAMLRRASDGEVVLVVEDEPAVLEMAVESIQELGYKTIQACDARQALDFLRGGGRVDILFSDVVMPGGMNGVQLTVEARRIRSDLKVVLASGYATSALDGASVPEDVPLIRKPYERDVLASTLQTVLRT